MTNDPDAEAVNKGELDETFDTMENIRTLSWKFIRNVRKNRAIKMGSTLLVIKDNKTREIKMSTTRSVSKSTSQQVVLRDATRALAGRYRCEVSADAPSFHTQVRSAYIHVVDYETHKKNETRDQIDLVFVI
ncbi:hypothetical protein ABMA28_015864 [Loxostege sticticalis]|uniref:Uncharacterized protein n=1 Tax=Loxostege sticticalis TaxID=481309 RepID=A0ABD0TBA9_LOXSC